MDFFFSGPCCLLGTFSSYSLTWPSSHSQRSSSRFTLLYCWRCRVILATSLWRRFIRKAIWGEIFWMSCYRCSPSALYRASDHHFCASDFECSLCVLAQPESDVSHRRPANPPIFDYSNIINPKASNLWKWSSAQLSKFPVDPFSRVRLQCLCLNRCKTFYSSTVTSRSVHYVFWSLTWSSSVLLRKVTGSYVSSVITFENQLLNSVLS